jgi:hypothetical protein
MSRLIAFGDSFTYGHYLDDHQTQSWPARLGLKLGIDVVNKADPGSSNVEILAEVLNFEFEKDDLIIIGWTYVERDVVFKKDTLFKIGKTSRFINYGKNRRLQAWTDDPVCEQWFNIFTDYDLGIKSGLHIHHAELFLDSLQLKQYHFLSHIQSYNPFENSPKWIHKPKNLINIIFKKVDLANDNNHPGILSHQLLADKLHDHITK